ncbi:MAG: protealysin inhibitor emfourin [Marmoricola sp.]
MTVSERCSFIPAYLLERLAAAEDPALAEGGHRTRLLDEQLRSRRSVIAPGAPGGPGVAATGDPWDVYTADHGSALPGTLVRAAGSPPSGEADAAVDEAATGVSQTLALLTDLGRSSYDGSGATVVATVHNERNNNNALWDGTPLVCGDGDGKVFGRFTSPIDVLGHELFHAVTQFTAGLTYSGQSGALNESISDCFGSCVKQRVLGQDAASADWLIGEGIFLPGVHGVALRSMKAPGTAYDDPAIGKDPQAASMAGYVETTDDNGGVHTNSGIPNRAFYLAATGVGGTSWEGAGRIWFAALTSGLDPDTDFAAFAAATVAAAGPHADVVRSAWKQVGVAAAGRSGKAPSPVLPPTSTPGTLTVRRTGGFGGLVREASLDLGGSDARATEARSLLDRVDLAALPAASPSAPPVADRYLYSFSWDGGDAQVHEPALTPELQRVVELAFE